ncbi:MAG: hypothetical protein D6711_03390 [Chloroflexi bacterium]|nr:MAG: hypothetical protein D6711_03390 [Chloroflexota bacterium]
MGKNLNLVGINRQTHKVCIQCKTVYPRTPEFWYMRSDKPHVPQSKCKSCHKQDVAKYKKKKKETGKLTAHSWCIQLIQMGVPNYRIRIELDRLFPDNRIDIEKVRRYTIRGGHVGDPSHPYNADHNYEMMVYATSKEDK